MGNIGENPPSENGPMKRLKNDLGGIPVTASIGRIFNNNTGCYHNPGTNPTAVAQ